MSEFTSIELFAGGGGFALGCRQAGFWNRYILDNNADAVQTLRINGFRADKGDVAVKNFQGLEADFLSGGFPCQSFSALGKRLGLADPRGELVFEFMRAIREVKPKVFLGENVRGLMQAEGGALLPRLLESFSALGYRVEARLLNALDYGVPQKRQRLIIIGVRNDLPGFVKWPEPLKERYTIRDALKAGSLWDTDCPKSGGARYSENLSRVMEQVPPGGCWRDLPLDVSVAYGGVNLGVKGGDTGVARRMSWEEPCLTLLCSPSQKQTERCHPEEVRPFTVREYARIQSFPDDWEFVGTVASQYKQIGNAVPVRMARALCTQVFNYLQTLES